MKYLQGKNIIALLAQNRKIQGELVREDSKRMVVGDKKSHGSAMGTIGPRGATKTRELQEQAPESYSLDAYLAIYVSSIRFSVTSVVRFLYRGQAVRQALQKLEQKAVCSCTQLSLKKDTN